MQQAASRFVIGLTGGIGSGKSEVSRRFEDIGIAVVDADIVARQIVEPNTPALRQISEHFGNSILMENGALDRAQLRTIIFSHPEEKKWLENLLHPLIRESIVQQLNVAESPCGDHKSPYAILSSPLLLETTQYQLVNRTLVVDAPEELQLARACARDSNNKDQIKAIMATQLSRLARKARADDIIDNSNTLTEIDRQVERLHSHYLTLAKHHD